MKKNLKIGISVTIDTEDHPQLIPPMIDSDLMSVRKLIEITDDFYERTDSYLRAVLRPEVYNEFLELVNEKLGSLTKDESALVNQFLLPLHEQSFISFKGVTKETTEST
jgi:hypothetical protein